MTNHDDDDDEDDDDDDEDAAVVVWWFYNLRESFILTCCTGFSPRKIHQSMGGPLLLHSDAPRSGSDILTSRTKWPEVHAVQEALGPCRPCLKMWVPRMQKFQQIILRTGSIPSPSFIMGDDESSILNKNTNW